jgi:hypothetical protein
MLKCSLHRNCELFTTRGFQHSYFNIRDLQNHTYTSYKQANSTAVNHSFKCCNSFTKFILHVNKTKQKLWKQKQTKKKLNSCVAGAVNNKIAYIYFTDHVNQWCAVQFRSPAPLTYVPQTPAKQIKTNNAMDMKQSMLWLYKLQVFRVHSSVTDNFPEMALVVKE